MRILVVRFAAIGDCVMTAWPVTAIRAALPEAKIVWAVQDRCSPVVDTDRLVNELHEVPRDDWKRRRGSIAVWGEQLRSYTALRKIPIDIGFDFQGHSKTALMLRLSGAKKRLASRATDAFASLLNPPRRLVPDGPHEIDLGFALVRSELDVPRVEPPLMPAVQGQGQEGTVTIQTGAGERRKAYPRELWSEVACSLSQKGLRVVSLGGKQDPHLDPGASEDAVGALDLRGAMGAVAASRVHLAADTGTGHIAAAYGVPVVSIFGPTDPARFRPYSSKAKVLKNAAEPGSVSPDQVVSACMELIGVA
ncbi:MAG: glycosyltransferase family 9 protein [Armatimonadetes bacterium]|nr:glycosyltransferase family 9 protein [Armatimonadota bacterium]